MKTGKSVQNNYVHQGLCIPLTQTRYFISFIFHTFHHISLNLNKLSIIFFVFNLRNLFIHTYMYYNRTIASDNYVDDDKDNYNNSNNNNNW